MQCDNKAHKVVFCRFSRAIFTNLASIEKVGLEKVGFTLVVFNTSIMKLTPFSSYSTTVVRVSLHLELLGCTG